MEWTPRQYPRVKAVLPVELRRATVTVPLRAQTQDICMGGLYVEMSFTQKVSTDLEITLWIGDTKISATGVVVSSHPSFGNGIKFTHLPDESKERLQDYLESMNRSGIGRRTTSARTAYNPPGRQGFNHWVFRKQVFSNGTSPWSRLRRSSRLEPRPR